MEVQELIVIVFSHTLDERVDSVLLTLVTRSQHITRRAISLNTVIFVQIRAARAQVRLAGYLLATFAVPAVFTL